MGNVVSEYKDLDSQVVHERLKPLCTELSHIDGDLQTKLIFGEVTEGDINQGQARLNIIIDILDCYGNDYTMMRAIRVQVQEVKDTLSMCRIYIGERNKIYDDGYDYSKWAFLLILVLVIGMVIIKTNV